MGRRRGEGRRGRRRVGGGGEGGTVEGGGGGVFGEGVETVFASILSPFLGFEF